MMSSFLCHVIFVHLYNRKKKKSNCKWDGLQLTVYVNVLMLFA